MEEKIVYHQVGKDQMYKTWHTSEEHLFMYFHSDGGSIVCSDDIFPIKKGVLVFIAADTYHYTMPDTPEIYDRSKLFVSRDELNKILNLLDADNSFRSFSDKAIVYSVIDEKDREEIDTVFRKASVCNGGDEKQLVLFACCMELLLHVNKYCQASTTSITGTMGKAIDYINKNIADNMNIDKICAAANISKYYFCRQFKKCTGMTVMQYILKTRIVLAKNDLKKTNLSVSEISEKNGFSSVSYFSRIFKAEEKSSPLQYRKANRT